MPCNQGCWILSSQSRLWWPPCNNGNSRTPENRFSELVRRAHDNGPQAVTIHGKPTAVVLSATAYDRLARPTPSLTEFLLSGPDWPDDLIDAVNDRPRDTGRPIDL